MKKGALETSVGIFVLIGLACLAYLTIRLGKMEIIGADYYFVNAKFGSVAGLKEGGMVEIAGVQVGKVHQIRLGKDGMTALVEMKIDDSVKLYNDTLGVVRTDGLIGDKRIRLDPGGVVDALDLDEPKALLAPGDMLLETESAIEIEDVIGKLLYGNVD